MVDRWQYAKLWFAANLAKGRFTGIVLYSGKDVLSFAENMLAVPLSALGC